MIYKNVKLKVMKEGEFFKYGYSPFNRSLKNFASENNGVIWIGQATSKHKAIRKLRALLRKFNTVKKIHLNKKYACFEDTYRHLQFSPVYYDNALIYTLFAD